MSPTPLNAGGTARTAAFAADLITTMTTTTPPARPPPTNRRTGATVSSNAYSPRLINEDGDEQSPQLLPVPNPSSNVPRKSLRRRPPLPGWTMTNPASLTWSPSPTKASGPPALAPPAPKTTKPKARIVLPTTDTAKPNETSMERAATRHHELAPPRSKNFPALPAAIPNTAYDHATRVHIEDRAHQLLTEAVENVAIVQVGDFFYRCPLNEMNIPFRRLRDREMLILNKMRYGDSLGPEDKFNFTAKYEREARKSRAFGNFDLHGNPTTEDLFPSAILTPTKPVLPL
ncbi:hypothetical protein EDB84DRAFT_1562339 [Lactarius hengduanensis]|nr:hypothetical protein EDB84DRAFT_1562339 [Lactarius hengduanensis]